MTKMTPEVIKVVLLFTLLISTFILSMIPLCLNSYVHNTHASRKKRKRVKAGLSLMSCFAAGVFLATCLLDLFPDAHDKLDQALRRMKIYTGYPMTEFIVVFGFLLIFFVEQIILTRKEAERSGELDPLIFHESGDSMTSSYGSSGNVYNPYQQARNNSPIQYRQLPASMPSDAEHSDIEGDRISGDDDFEHVDPNTPEVYADPNAHSVIRSFMLLLALSLHSIFEGLAVGLQPTTDSILAIFLPVALHKCILAFALGLNLTQSKLSVKSIVRSNATFAVTSPIGIAIGIIITLFAPASVITDLITGIIQAIACGTFLFVVFFEILPHEFMDPKRHVSRLLQTLLLVLGYSTVASLLFLDPDIVSPSDFINPSPAP